jgi:hypothetical protein
MKLIKLDEILIKLDKTEKFVNNLHIFNFVCQTFYSIPESIQNHLQYRCCLYSQRSIHLE